MKDVMLVIICFEGYAALPFSLTLERLFMDMIIVVDHTIILLQNMMSFVTIYVVFFLGRHG
jgi:hypothetical protein